MSDDLVGGDALREEITRLRSEVLEQARLLDMSAEREARLRARVEELWGKWSLVRREEARLLARVEVLERVRAAAQALDGYGFGWVHWDEMFETLRVALKEAKP
jgi:polyhydroxyalkanoate synthesis regulator phasin